MLTDIADLIDEIDIDPPASRYRETLDAFIEVAVRTAETNDLDEILHLAARRICDLVKVNRCSIFLRGDDGMLHGQVGHSYDNSIDERIKRLVSGGKRDLFTQELIARREPILVLDAARDGRLEPLLVRRFDIRDILGVPLVFDGDVIGAIYLDNLADEHVYSHEEIEVAQTFARLAALAIRRAWLMSQLTRRTSIIERQRNVLERLSHIHAELTNAVVSGEDVRAIVQRLVTLVDKPVVVYNESFVDVAYGAPERLGSERPPRLPEKAVRSAWFLRQLANLGPERSSVVIAPSMDVGLTARRVISPLRIEGSLAGYVEVIEIGQSINTIDLKVVEHGATVLSLAMLSERRAVAAEGQAREGFFTDLLQGDRDPAVLARRAPLFGVDLDQPHVVLRVAHEPGADGERSRAAQREAIGAVVRRSAHVACVASISVPGADVFLLGPLDDDTAPALERMRAALEAAFAAPHPSVPLGRAALSPVCRHPEDYAATNRDLAEAIDLLAALGRRTAVILQTDLGMLRLLTGDGRRREAVRFAHDLLQPLVAHDGDASGDLLNTLRAYLASGGHIRATAGDLGVHENTVRYRLGKIRSISAIDPDRLDDLLDARFALQVLDLSTEGGADATATEPG
ncbi:MAG TPA: GAF domain-containing protein [Acidimicrobiales bacterium]|nr:GAF domain-containing protein [Acidimicrobiales bacterium]